MPDKRKDSKGRSLRSGESQLPDGRYKFQYTDSDGSRKAVYSWGLVNTDRPKGTQRQSVNLKVPQDVMGHRNIRTTMEVCARAARDKKLEAIREMNGIKTS